MPFGSQGILESLPLKLCTAVYLGMLKSIRRKLTMFNAGCSACGCCTIGFVIVAVVFSVLVLPEYQLINSFQQDSCMMYDCGGSCLDRRGAGLCSWNTLANTDQCTLYYNVTVLRPRIASTFMVLDPSLKKETSLKISPNVSFPCFTTDAVEGEFQIYYGGQPPYSQKFLSTTGLTFGLTMFLFFLPAMILINAVVEPEFLSKLRGGSDIGSNFRVQLE